LLRSGGKRRARVALAFIFPFAAVAGGFLSLACLAAAKFEPTILAASAFGPLSRYEVRPIFMPLLSIVIPTRNRQHFAISLVETIVREYPTVELIISDNSDDDSLGQQIARFGDVQYAHASDLLSVVDNCDRGLARATGDYVMMMGDDDTVGPNLLDIVSWAKHNAVDAVTCLGPKTVCQYFWPSVTHPIWGKIVPGSVFLSAFTGQIEWLEPSVEIRQALLELGGGPHSLPRLYLGLVAREALLRARARYGSIFGSVSPDVYSGLLIAKVARRFCRADYPFVLPGAGAGSSSAERSERTDHSELHQAEHITRFRAIDWDPRIPSFYGPAPIWGAAALIAAQTIGEPVPDLGFARLYGKCLLGAWKFRKATFAASQFLYRDRSRLDIGALILRGLASTIFRRLQHFGKLALRPRPGAAKYHYSNLQTSNDAFEMLRRHVQQVGIDVVLMQQLGGIRSQPQRQPQPRD
jgi:hypothetical protein